MNRAPRGRRLLSVALRKIYHPRWLSAVAAICCGSLGACFVSLDLPDGAQVSCGSDADCPEGYFCLVESSKCFVLGGDQEPPGLVDAETELLPAVAPLAAPVTLRIQATEALEAAPVVTIDVGGRLVTMEPVAADTFPDARVYAYTYTPDGSETEGRTSFVTVDLLDLAGNSAAALVAGAIEFDFTPPGINFASVAYVPGADSPLAIVDAAKEGTEIVVVATADELLDSAGPAALVASLGTTQLDFLLDTTLSSDRTLAFRVTVPAGADTGVYTPDLQWSDRAGNVSSRTTFVTPQILVDTTRPALSVIQQNVIFLRSPWGRDDDEDQSGFTMPAGPRFELAPTDPLGGATALAAATFTLEGSVAPTRVRVWADPNGDSLLGTLRLTNGAWPRQALANLDAPAAYVTGVDSAGNESDPTRITTAEWVATPRPDSSGTSPHRVSAVGRVLPPLNQTALEVTSQIVPSGSSPAAALTNPDDDTVVVVGQGTWRRVLTATAHPSARGMHGCAFDAGRGTAILWGGALSACSGCGLSDTWQWDGSHWQPVVGEAPPPPADFEQAMVYDARRGRVLLLANNLWELDDNNWRQIDEGTLRPDTRFRSAAAYDSARGVTVLYGDGNYTGSTWEWDGSAWTEFPAVGGGPTTRADTALAYDPTLGTVWMHGGDGSSGLLADTWSWDGGKWTLAQQTSPSGPRMGHSMAFDPRSGKVTLFSGEESVRLNDVWEWNGTTWLNITPLGGGPGERTQHTTCWDGERLLLVGGRGAGGAAQADTWQWESGAWRSVNTAGSWPSKRRFHGMSFDTTRDRVVLFSGTDSNSVFNLGGLLNDLWEWDGTGWQDRTVGGGPTARVGASLVFDPIAGLTLIFGGAEPLGASENYPDDTWAWNDGTWGDISDANRPAGRLGAGWAYDQSRDRFVLFGGWDGTSILRDVWEFNGATWSDVTPAPTATQPAARVHHSMVYDGRRMRVLVTGGCNAVDGDAFCSGGTFFGDFWEWNGAVWENRTPIAPAPGRSHAGAAFDPDNGRVFIFGGWDGITALGDLVEWDGDWWTPLWQPNSPTVTYGVKLVYDDNRGEILAFGGVAAGISADLWSWTGPASRQPAVQLAVTAKTAGIPAGAIEKVSIRANCDGIYAPYGPADTGASLWAWSSNAGAIGAGWTELGGVVTTPGSGGSSLPRLDWQSTSAAQAQALYGERDGRLAVHCRPAGVTTIADQIPTAFPISSVEADLIEIRVRYQTQGP